MLFSATVQKRRIKMINSKFGEIEKNRGITLIALVVTIIVLLILARCQYQYVDWAKWDFKQGVRGKGKDGTKSKTKKIRYGKFRRFDK